VASRDGQAGSLDLSRDAGLRAAWHAHADELMGYACRSLADRAAAEEAVQETFLRAWRSAGSYDPSRPLRPWLFAILRHVVVDEARARTRRAVPSAERVADQEALEAERLLDEWVVHEALLRIPAEQRTILLRTFYGGERYTDVARDLGIPEGTARTRAFYGLRALRTRLEELGWER
jgi:RNA polymerase sigma-70 factor (ECF subfamily)